MFDGIAKFERSLIVEHTSAGRAAAKARGIKFGRKPKLEPAQIKHIHQLVDEGKTSRQEIADLFGIDRSTLYRVLLQRSMQGDGLAKDYESSPSRDRRTATT